MGRRTIKARKEALKSRGGDHIKDAEKAVRDYRRTYELSIGSGCISCGESQESILSAQVWKVGGAFDGVRSALHASKVERLTDAIEHSYLELSDNCNPNHMVASGWIAVPAEVSLEEAQAAKLLYAAGAWHQVKVAA